MSTERKANKIQWNRLLFVLSCILLGFVLWDTVIKSMLAAMGFFRFLVKLYAPDKTFFGITYGIWTVRLIPATILLLVLTGVQRRKTGNGPSLKRMFIINGITLTWQAVVLMIALKNNGVL